jgi:D-alanine-D-alanine ligase
VTRITVLTGGATPERTVALAGAAQIVAALRSRGHTVRVVDTTQGLVSQGEEARLLANAVGAGPTDVGDLVDRERAMLSNGLATLPAVRDAEALFLSVHGGAGEGGALQAVLDVVGSHTGSGRWRRLAMDRSREALFPGRACRCPRGS